MEIEKRKEEGHKRPSSKRLVWIFPLLLTAVLFIGTPPDGIRPAYSGVSEPVYEEPPSVPPALQSQITQVDYWIYEALFAEGVPERDVLFTLVEPREERGFEWEFTEMLIRVSEGPMALRLEDSLQRTVSALEPEVTHRREPRGSQETVWHLYSLGCYTHRIRIAVEEPAKGPETRLPPRIAVVIDDLGYDLEIARAFMQLDSALSLSVLPSARHAPVIAREARERGHDVLLHLPMEAKGHHRASLGPGGLMKGMKEDAIRETLKGHFLRIPGACGVNNHMGSKFTELEAEMSVVLEELKGRGLFYLDSRTTPRSVAERLATRMGVPVVARNVFLDNKLSSAGLRVQTDRLLGIARHARYAVGIAHPHRETLRSLKENLPRLKREARIVAVSELAAGNTAASSARTP